MNDFCVILKAKDFRLLMNQLAEKSGLSYALRILSQFDNDFQRQWKPIDIKVGGGQTNHIILTGLGSGLCYFDCPKTLVSLVRRIGFVE
jgi:hypothetical protein